jgi:hypothetical protein
MQTDFYHGLLSVAWSLSVTLALAIGGFGSNADAAAPQRIISIIPSGVSVIRCPRSGAGADWTNCRRSPSESTVGRPILVERILSLKPDLAVVYKHRLS